MYGYTTSAMRTPPRSSSAASIRRSSQMPLVTAVAFTMDLCSHVLPSMQEQAASAMEVALGEPLTE